MDDIAILNSEIEEIKKRNAKVEADKAWEISWTLKDIISVLTLSLSFSILPNCKSRS